MHAFDIFHKLFVVRYGGDELTPYMIKLVAVSHILLAKLPVPSLMRFATEGGEHSHCTQSCYTQSCFYYQHIQRGGSPKTRDSITTTLYWTYRKLRSRILANIGSSDLVKHSSALKFRDWCQKEVAAYKIPKIVRGFLARNRFKKAGRLSHLSLIL